MYNPNLNINAFNMKTFVKIDGAEKGNDTITFTSKDGEVFQMFHEQECCEGVQIEDICGDINDLIGYPILLAEEVQQNAELDYDSGTWTFYKLSTIKGNVTLRWLGTSNGYYSESVSIQRINN